MRQYAQEKLGESGEADAVRDRHRDHYTAMAAAARCRRRGTGYERLMDQAEIEIDNLRAAFAWSRENSDLEQALRLASSLQTIWITRGRFREGLAWFDAVVTDEPATGRGRAGGARAGTGRQRPCATALVAAHGSWIERSKPWRSHGNSTTRP